MALLKLLLALLLLAPAIILGATVTFNTTVTEWCTTAAGGCSFTNASIWVNSTAPSDPSDIVNITGLEPNSTSAVPLIYLPSNSSFNLSSLILEQVHFVVSADSSLTVSSSLVSIAWLEVAANGSFSAPSSQSNVDIWGSLVVHGSFVSNGNVSLQFTDIQVFSTAYVSLNNVSYIADNITLAANVYIQNFTILEDTSGELNFVNGSSLVIQNFNVGARSAITITGLINIPQVHVATNATLTITGNGIIGSNTSSISGNGTINIDNSVLSISSEAESPSVFGGSINVAGNSQLTLKQLQVNNFTTAAGVTVYADGLVLAGASTPLTATWVALGGGLNISGWSELVGTLQVLTKLAITPTGSLLLNGNQYSAAQNSTILLGGYISGNIHVLPQTTFELYDGSNATINGNLINNGTLVLNGDHPLHVYGDVALGADAAVHASLTGDNDTPLVVNNGSIALAGQLGYNLVKKPFLKSEKFLLAEISSTVNHTISGTFNGTATALKDSEIDRPLKLEYHPSQVYVLYGFEIHDVDPWVWVVFSLIVVVLIAAIVGIVVHLRRRRDYQPVP